MIGDLMSDLQIDLLEGPDSLINFALRRNSISTSRCRSLVA
jgi:hypothetical protein